jgi:hypothetical protein
LIYSSSSVKSDSSALTLTLFDLDVLFFLGLTAFLAFVYIVSLTMDKAMAADLCPSPPTSSDNTSTFSFFFHLHLYIPFFLF